jgi:hypothetical protein
MRALTALLQASAMTSCVLRRWNVSWRRLPCLLEDRQEIVESQARHAPCLLYKGARPLALLFITLETAF